MPGPILHYSLGDLPNSLPIFPLSGVLLLPRGRLPLNIFEPRYLAMIDDAMARHRLIGMIQPDSEQTQPPGLCAVGCAGRITSLSETEDGRYIVNLSGIIRFRVGLELSTATPYRQVQPLYDVFENDLTSERAGTSAATTIDRPRLLSTLRRYLDVNKMKADWSGIEESEPENLVNSLCMICPFEVAEKQALIEAETLADRSEVLITLIEMSIASRMGGPAPSVQ